MFAQRLQRKRYLSRGMDKNPSARAGKNPWENKYTFCGS